MTDYELSGIENIARGICIVGGKVLLCRGKGLDSTYLPGGHIEFGETGREALVREMKEETGRDAKAGAFVNVVENSFLQKGKRHCEINLVYEMEIGEGEDQRSEVRGQTAEDSIIRLFDYSIISREDWIGFEWCDVDNLDAANLLPVEMRELVAAVATRGR